ncbi:MAG UNVERIFIED_CONTAM: hypothetical protein LVQ98_01690 [Rickettsiaceae bacterium]|jgi:hypothetical protein
MKFLDSTGRVKRADIISEILSDITLQRQGTDYTRVNDLKLSWAERIKTDSESQNKIGVKT